MKQLSVILFTLLAVSAFSQVHCAETTLNKDFTGIFTSPNQGMKPAELSSVSYQDFLLTFKVNKSLLNSEGSFEPDDKIGGKLLRAGNCYFFINQREKLLEKQVNRSQTPKPPRSYLFEKQLIRSAGNGVRLSEKKLIQDTRNHNVPIMAFIRGSISQNHLLQECESSVAIEYGKIEVSISSETLDLLLFWNSKQS